MVNATYELLRIDQMLHYLRRLSVIVEGEGEREIAIEIVANSTSNVKAATELTRLVS